MDCDFCGTYYSCLVEGQGDASDSVISFSEDTLKEMARIKLDIALQHKAANNPCPNCGAYPKLHVEHVQKTIGRLIGWGLFIGIFIALSVLLAMLAPKAPVWTLFFVLIGSFAATKLLGKPLNSLLEPNRNMEKNRQLAQSRLQNGIIRINLQIAQGKTEDLN
jgi:hypothetical protein